MADEVYIALFDSIPTWVMLLPIFLCSIIALAVIMERVLFYRRINSDYRHIIESCVGNITAGKTAEARECCRRHTGPIIEIITSTLDRFDRGMRETTFLRDVAENAVRRVEKYTGVISTIATIAPMFGLFGTVTGMMKSFSALTRVGQFAYDQLARGIAEALITTALGLMVAIPAWIFYNYMVSRVEYFIREIEHVSNSLLVFTENRERPNG